MSHLGDIFLYVKTLIFGKGMYKLLIQLSDQYIHRAYQLQALSLDAKDVHEIEKSSLPQELNDLIHC